MADQHACPACESIQVSEVMQSEIFQAIVKCREITLKVDFPLLTCADCGLQYTDYRTESIRDKAVAAAHENDQ